MGWLLALAGLWTLSFFASAYLGFVPAKGHVAPRSRTIWQVVGSLSVLLVGVGLFASLGTAESVTYSADASSVVKHGRSCSLFGVSTGILPGVITLLLMRRYVPVGKRSVGLSLGAAGGALAGLALLFHCPISERFHVGFVHGGIIVIASFFVASAAQILMRER